MSWTGRRRECQTRALLVPLYEVGQVLRFPLRVLVVSVHIILAIGRLQENKLPRSSSFGFQRKLFLWGQDQVGSTIFHVNNVGVVDFGRIITALFSRIILVVLTQR